MIAIELASGDGSEERDQTPFKGKYWVYERIIRIPYYTIYEVNNAKLEVYELVSGVYQNLTANERGHYLIPPLRVELGLLQGIYQNQEFLWLRWWDLEGNLLLIGNERAEKERHRAEQESQRAIKLAERLQAMGVDLDAEGLS